MADYPLPEKHEQYDGCCPWCEEYCAEPYWVLKEAARRVVRVLDTYSAASFPEVDELRALVER